MSQTLRAAVIPSLAFIVGDTTYTVEFPLSAVIMAEAKLGRSLKTPADWFCATAKDIPALLEAGLSRHHPDITPEAIAEICGHINPESYTEVTEALGALAFPRWLEQYKANLEGLRAAAAEGKSPKESSATAP